MDTNQFANSGSGGASPQAAAPMPTTPVNGVAAMIKAIMDGNAAYKQQNANAPSALSPGSMVPGASGATSVGGAAGPTPLVNPATMAGGLGGAGGAAGTPMGMAPGMGAANPFTQGGQPITMDPVSNALMSPIPGMGNG